MKDDSIPGSTGFWVAFTLIAWLVWVVVGAWNRDKELDARRAELNAPRAETAAEASAADAAERLPAIAVIPGLWVRERERAPRERIAWLLRADGSFVATVADAGADAPRYRETASGQWKINARTLVFRVDEGARGLFPSTGRVVVRRASAGALAVAEDAGEAVFQEQSGLGRASAARDAERNALESGAVGIVVKAALLMALLVVGWSVLRQWHDGRF